MLPFATVVSLLLALSVATPPRRRSEYRIFPGVSRSSSPPPSPPKEEDLPQSWDWRNVSGVNYVTPSLNQHLPVWCGSCWAHAALSSVADRIKIARRAAWPDVQLSVQVVLNCGQDVAGSCDGGSDSGAYAFLHTKGVPDATCQAYVAQDMACSANTTCRTCDEDGTCHAIKAATAGSDIGAGFYTNWRVGAYGAVPTGEAAMRAEIYARGPISCGVDATPILSYTGGIFSQDPGDFAIDHVVSIVGWGEEGGIPFWYARNSWGTPWGERGYIRVERGKNVIGIESGCNFAIPIMPDTNKTTDTYRWW